MANKDIVQETFPVLGMSCASCSARVEKTLNHQPGVRKAVVNYASAMATVEYDLHATNRVSPSPPAVPRNITGCHV